MNEYAKQLIDALRCSASPPSERESRPDCKDCAFCVIECLDDEMAAMVGKDEWVSCDVDRIAFEAAAMLEELSHG